MFAKLKLAWQYRADIKILLATIAYRRTGGSEAAIHWHMQYMLLGELQSTQLHLMQASEFVLRRRRELADSRDLTADVDQA